MISIVEQPGAVTIVRPEAPCLTNYRKTPSPASERLEKPGIGNVLE